MNQDKIDVSQKPFSLMISPGIREAIICVFGQQIRLHDSYALEAYGLTERLNRSFALWAREIEAEVNRGADAILSDMLKDSVAYCTGYNRGADVLELLLKTAIRDRLDNLTEPLLRLQWVQFLDKVISVRKQVPAPNPDDEGFGKTSLGRSFIGPEG
jgi:hypothetical protein